MKAILFIALVLVLGAAAYVYQGYKPAWQFDHLEQNARKVITAAELQAWATNLIAMHPTNNWVSFRASELGTNFPQQLRQLAPRVGPHVEVCRWEDTNEPPWVRVWWGSGFLGHAGFEIGPTNFDRGRGHPWASGVYFFKQ